VGANKKASAKVKDRQQALARLREMVEIPDHLGFNTDGEPVEILLFQCKVTDADMESFRFFPTFETINVGECPITDAGLVHLSEMHKLHFLDLADNERITDAGLAHIRHLRSLSTLNLFGCSITDAGLVSLRTLSSLRRLIVDENILGDEAIRDVLEAIPGLRILDAFGTEIA
jgi:hypothetical protein